MNGNTTETTTDCNDYQNSNQTIDSVDNQMNLSFGKKRFFGKKSDPTSESHQNQSKSVDSQVNNTSKKTHNKWPTITSSSSSNQLSNNNSNGYKSEANDLQNEDKFLGEGIQFSAKLIGHEFVAEARGELMCQQSLKKLKILQRGLGGHKRKVHLFISFEGIKIRDATTSELIYHHSVPQISFISRDESDTRAFGYVFGSSSTGHQFIAFKTQKEAMPIMSSIGQLFAATLKRKKSEIITDSVITGTANSISPILSGNINDEKMRRESSATLRPSRSESPNVPSMPAPPVPTNNSTSSAPAVEEIDFFSAFEPMDSVFETDFKVNKEKLEQIPITGTDPLSNDPFASSFGSLSLSSGDWANFDEDNLSASGGSHQKSYNRPFGLNSKPFDISIPLSRDTQQKAQQMANSFSDSSSSMALRDLFSASGNHNQLNTSAQFSPNIVNSEAMAIPSRNGDRNKFQSSVNNQSVGSTSSSTDRYACFNEIHSISSSIFDSMCDQMAAEADLQLSKEQNPNSKSLNSSLNGGFGVGYQQQLSSSLNTAGNNFYYSFDNPLNSEQQKQNFLYSNNYQNSGLSSQQNTNELNAQNVWNNNFNNNSDINPNNNSFNTTNNQPNNVWSTSSSLSDRSLANSQVSGASSPPPPLMTAPTPPNPMTATGFGMNRSNDILSETKPVFAELDPLGKDKPFIDKSLFFAEQKQKPTLRDLNSDFPSNNRSMSANSVPLYNQTNDVLNQTPQNVSIIRSRPLSSNANPFNESSESSRMSPNPFNPFNTTNSALEAVTPPLMAPSSFAPTLPEKSYTPSPPAPPPRPSSRDCPPVPPRNDLNREIAKTATLEAAPPLPRRRTVLPEHRYQTFEAIHRQSVDPFSPNLPKNISDNNFSANYCSDFIKPLTEDLILAPPLPNPQRKVPSNPVPNVPPPQPMARKLSSSSSASSEKTTQTGNQMTSSSAWDPFNCSFVDSQLSSISGENTQKSVLNIIKSDIQSINASNISTPKQSTDLVPNLRQFPEEFKLTEIKSRYDWIKPEVSDEKVETPIVDEEFEDTSGFSSDFSQFSEQKLFKQNMNLNLNPNNLSENSEKSVTKVSEQNLVLNKSSSVDSQEDHISPPERNIFIVKSDPFADDFFA